MDYEINYILITLCNLYTKSIKQSGIYKVENILFLKAL